MMLLIWIDFKFEFLFIYWVWVCLLIVLFILLGRWFYFDVVTFWIWFDYSAAVVLRFTWYFVANCSLVVCILFRVLTTLAWFGWFACEFVDLVRVCMVVWSLSVGGMVDLVVFLFVCWRLGCCFTCLMFTYCYVVCFDWFDVLGWVTFVKLGLLVCLFCLLLDGFI